MIQLRVMRENDSCPVGMLQVSVVSGFRFRIQGLFLCFCNEFLCARVIIFFLQGVLYTSPHEKLACLQQKKRIFFLTHVFYRRVKDKSLRRRARLRPAAVLTSNVSRVQETPQPAFLRKILTRSRPFEMVALLTD